MANLKCKHDGCNLVVRELTRRKCLHKMRLHEQQVEHPSGHKELIEEEFGLTNSDEDEEKEDDEDDDSGGVVYGPRRPGRLRDDDDDDDDGPNSAARRGGFIG